MHCAHEEEKICVELRAPPLRATGLMNTRSLSLASCTVLRKRTERLIFTARQDILVACGLSWTAAPALDRCQANQRCDVQSVATAHCHRPSIIVVIIRLWSSRHFHPSRTHRVQYRHKSSCALQRLAIKQCRRGLSVLSSTWSALALPPPFLRPALPLLRSAVVLTGTPLCVVVALCSLPRCRSRKPPSCWPRSRPARARARRRQGTHAHSVAYSLASARAPSVGCPRALRAAAMSRSTSIRTLSSVTILQGDFLSPRQSSSSSPSLPLQPSSIPRSPSSASSPSLVGCAVGPPAPHASAPLLPPRSLLTPSSLFPLWLRCACVCVEVVQG